MYSPQYHIPPQSGFMSYGYGASPMTPPSGADYFTPKYNYYTPSPSRTAARGHSRGASYEPAGYAYANPKPYKYQTPPAYDTAYYPSPFVKPNRAEFEVSTRKMRSKARTAGVSPDGKSHSKSSRVYSSQTRFEVHVDEFSTTATNGDPPRYRARTRTNSTPIPVRHTQTKPKESQPRSPPKSPLKATAADAEAARIPAGYSLKNWDPTETPILLLGSVFDANSLGKWIYDWTVYSHDPASPMADMAGELWLGLIQLAGKIKRSEEVLPRIRRLDDREMVEEFLESGERLWDRFKAILKTCEDFMWRAARKESGGKKAVTMGARSGCEFVESIFGRDRKLKDTEQLMASMRLWTMRFDANCEEILSYPSG